MSWAPIAWRGRPGRRVLAALLAVPTLLGGPSAFAATRKPVVLSGSAGGIAPDAAATAALAKTTLGSGDFELAGDLDAALRLDAAPLFVLGAAQTACAGHPVPRSQFAAALSGASESVDMLEFGAARASLKAARAALPCLDAPADAESLYRVWFLEGLSAFQEGNEEEARRAFAAAAVIDPTRQWNPDYPPAPQGTFLGALQDALTRRSAPLTRDAGLSGELRVDGRVFAAGDELLAGTHLLQLTHEGSTAGVLVDLPTAGGWLSVLPPEILRVRILRGEPAVAQFLGRALSGTGWEDVVLVSELGAAVFSLSKGAFVRAPSGAATPAGAPPERSGGGSIAGGVVAAAGAGVAAAGFATHALGWSKGQTALDARDRTVYEAAFTENRLGLGLGIAGAVAAGTGVIAAIVSAATATRGTSLSAQRRRAQNARRNALTAEENP